MGLSPRRFESFPLRSYIPGQLLRIRLPRGLYSKSFREGSFSETRPAPVLLAQVLTYRTPLHRTGYELYSIFTQLPRRKVHSPGPSSYSSSSSSVEAVVSTWIVIPKFSLSHERTATYIASPSRVSAPSKCSKRSKPVVSDTPASIPASSSFASCINLRSPRVSTTSLVLHVPSALFTAPLRDGSYFYPALRPGPLLPT